VLTSVGPLVDQVEDDADEDDETDAGVFPEDPVEHPERTGTV